LPKEYVLREGPQFTLISPSFKDGDFIPRRHTCDGDDVSPRLEWEGQPPNARSFALIMYDPDAPMGTFIHWVIYNIPASVRSIPEGVQKEAESLPGLGFAGR